MTHSSTDTIVTPARSDKRLAGENPIRALQRFGQSVWLDDVRRSLFTGGEFRRLIAEESAFRSAT